MNGSWMVICMSSNESPPRPWRIVKEKTPIIGIDDGGFDRDLISSETTNYVPVFGVIMKGAAYVDGVIQCEIQKDDPNPTRALSQMLLTSSHKAQLQAILFQGITIGGFGIINIQEIFEVTGIPVIVILRKVPNFEKIHLALQKNFSDAKKRWSLILKAGKPLRVQSQPELYLQLAGIRPDDAALLIRKCTKVGVIPEALRIAHFIGASNYRFHNEKDS